MSDLERENAQLKMEVEHLQITNNLLSSLLDQYRKLIDKMLKSNSHEEHSL